MEIEKLSSFKVIAGVALPAVVLNVAPPITAAVQTALLGNYAPTAALAAFAAVSICVGFIARVFNFLVGRSVGHRDWASLATHVALSVRWSAALGAGAVPLLLAARRPLCGALLALDAEVQAAAAPYWLLRAWTTPLNLLNMSAAGILQGFSRVRVNAALTSSAAILEMVGSLAVLRWHAAHGGAGGPGSSAGALRALGLVTLACQALLAVASLLCIIALPPLEAQGRVRLVREVLGLGGGGGSACGSGGGEGLASSGEGAAVADARQALLAGEHAAGGRNGATLQLPPSSPRSGAAGAEQPCVPHQPGAPQAALDEQCSRGGDASAKQGRTLAGLFDNATLEFLRDGANMFIRSMTLQLTFFMALAAAARLGTAALAAHSIIGQLWVVVSYGVDGFAAAGIVLGSRLFAHARSPQLRGEAHRHMRRLVRRVLLAGLISGLAAGLCFLAARPHIISAFTADPQVAAALQKGAWVVLAAAQPLNGLLFVFDGLAYATQQFRFVRNNMVSGFLLLFCPLLALEAWVLPGLAPIWLAKAALNLWRLAGAVYLVFFLFLPQFGSGGEAQGGGGCGAGDASAVQGEGEDALVV